MDLSERGASSQRHPWEVVRGEFFLGLVAEYAPRATQVVDVGAGDSWFGTCLAASGHVADVVCWDSAYMSEDLRDAPEGVIRTVEAPHARFDLVLMLDVLEHIEDPAAFLTSDVRPLLAPNAIVIASVPAHPRLYGPHDVTLGHYRRYRRHRFESELELLGTRLASGPLFASLTVPRAASVWGSRVTARLGTRPPRSGPQSGVGNWHHRALLTAAVTTALRLDARVCRRLSRSALSPPGLSHWAVVQTREER